MRIEVKNGSVTSRPMPTWRAVTANACATRLALKVLLSAALTSRSNPSSIAPASSPR